MIFGKHINRYYLRYSVALLLGIFALVLVDILQLKVPELYQMIVNGMNQGWVLVDGVPHTFDMDFLLDRICMPMLTVILCMCSADFCGVWPSLVWPSGWKPICVTECSPMPKI